MKELEDAKLHLMECPEDAVDYVADLLNAGLMWLQYQEMNEIAHKALDEDASADVEKILSEYNGIGVQDIMLKVEDKIDEILIRTAKNESVDWIIDDIKERERDEGTNTDQES